MSGNIFKTGFMIMLLVTLISCNRNRNKPGWDYFPDMFYSPAYETYSPNPNFKDGKTMREPVNGTVPREYIPFDYTIDPEDRIRAGKELKNPFESSTEVLNRGKKVFSMFCIGCHGSNGLGDGHLYTSGLYPVKPRSLAAESAIKLKDGEIFHSITVGFGSMGAHGSQIRTEDRWKVVSYIRELQKNTSLNADTVKIK